MTFPRCHNASGKPCEFSQVCPQRRQETAQKFAKFEGIQLDPKQCSWYADELSVAAGYHPPVVPEIVVKRGLLVNEAADERAGIEGESAA